MIPHSRAKCGALWAFVMMSTASCGPEIIVAPRGDGGTGGMSITSSSSASSSSGNGGSSACVLEDVSTWKIESFNAGGNHPRFATATSGVPWVALAVEKANVVLEKLGVQDQGIMVLEKFEIPDSLVYPLAFDANDQRFVLLTTTGNNWNGTLEIWLVDRTSGAVLRQPVEKPDDPNLTLRAALGLVDDNIALAYVRSANMQGTIEIRNAKLEVIVSQTVGASDFQGVSRNPSGLDIYFSGSSRAIVENGAIKVEITLPDLKIIGGLGEFLVDIGDKITLLNGSAAWPGAWPHTQISPPAIVRTHGSTGVFALETELTGVVGYPKGNMLEWLRIESQPGASGIGVAVLPVVEERRLGLFYIGLEIPQPEQPLRYFGRVCP